ncbi:MAG: transcriptional regulator [Proteobacteria bacterium]|nr:transcriptional regulator [Pseudomonadota bacterium]
MRVEARIQKWGNSLGLRITGVMKTIPQFKAEMPVVIEINKQGIKVTPSKRIAILPLTEKQLLKGLNRKTAHADALAIITHKEWAD